MSEKFLRRRDVESRVGLKRSAIYERVAKGTFPAPVREMEGGAVWWLESEIEAWMAERIATSRGGSNGGSNSPSKEKAA